MINLSKPWRHIHKTSAVRDAVFVIVGTVILVIALTWPDGWRFVGIKPQEGKPPSEVLVLKQKTHRGYRWVSG